MTARDERRRLFTRRLLVFGGGAVGGFALLAGRLYQLQVLNHDRYVLLSDRNRIRVEPLTPRRGRLLAADGAVLADGRSRFVARLDDDDAADADQRRRIAALLGGSVTAEHPLVLDWEDAARLLVNKPDLPGLRVAEEDVRRYPLGAAAAHVIGYVGAPGPEAGLPRGIEIVGKVGMEAVADDDLRGSPGRREVETNAAGRRVRRLRETPPKPGRDVRLTVDRDLQVGLHTLLSRHRRAAGAVLDVETGAIRALVSTPGFDAEALSDTIRPADWRRLVSDVDRSLFNRAVAGLYPPGSTFKMVVAVAALTEQRVASEETVFCPGYLDIGDTRLHCWKRGGHGHVICAEALAQSCDVYFYEAALRTGMGAIERAGVLLGLGTSTKTGVASEPSGRIPTPEWKRAVLGSPWMKGETAIAGIGQGFVEATPLQLAVMTARLASGRVVEPALRDASPGAPTLPIAPAVLDVVRRGMERAVRSRHGTARRLLRIAPGLSLAGKTGTSQVRRISGQERRTGVRGNDELPWEERDHALFVGYGPIDAPRLAISVIVEHGGGGSSVAAPIAATLLAPRLAGAVAEVG